MKKYIKASTVNIPKEVENKINTFFCKKMQEYWNKVGDSQENVTVTSIQRESEYDDYDSYREPVQCYIVTFSNGIESFIYARENTPYFPKDLVENNLGLMGIDLAEYLKQEYGLMSAASYVSERGIPIVEY